MSRLLGAKRLHQAIHDLGNMNSREWQATMKSAVRNPMGKVRRRAQGNLARISPGKALLHRTYKGRLVSRGFASRSLRVLARVYTAGGEFRARAILGVKAEAFYVVQFFEKGTSRIPRQPWLVPALESMKDTAVTDVGKAIVRRITSIAKKWNAKSRSETR